MRDIRVVVSMMNRWKGLLSVSLSFVVCAYAVFEWPFFFEGRQDKCSFGPVSSEDYRDMLADAQSRLRDGSWAPLAISATGRSASISEQLRSRVDQMIVDKESIYKKIAGVHAALRASGAIYRSASAVPFQGATELVEQPYDDKHSMIKYGYYLDSYRYGFRVPYRRWIAVFVNYYLRDFRDLTTGAVTHKKGSIFVYAYAPSFFDPSYATISVSPHGEACPPVPKVR